MATNKSSNVVYHSGIGFTGLLTVLFVTFKVFGLVNWSWWLVFLPVLIGPAIILAVLLVLGAVALLSVILIFVLERYSSWKSRRRLAAQKRRACC